jgi:hypothetical protein
MDGWIHGLGFAVVKCNLRSALLDLFDLRKEGSEERKFKFLDEHELKKATLPELREIVLCQTYVRHHAFGYTPPNTHSHNVTFDI